MAALYYCSTWMPYHQRAPWPDIPLTHIILTSNQLLEIPRNKQGSDNLYFKYMFSRPGIEPTLCCTRFERSVQSAVLSCSSIHNCSCLLATHTFNSVHFAFQHLGHIQGTTSEMSQRNLIHLPTLNTVLPRK